METKTPKYAGLYAPAVQAYLRTYDNGLSDGLGSELSAPYFGLPGWQKLDWSLAQINLNHSFTGSVIYDLCPSAMEGNLATAGMYCNKRAAFSAASSSDSYRASLFRIRLL